jgi:hypothetical protein
VNLLGQPAYVGRHCGIERLRRDKAVVDFYADALGDRHALAVASSRRRCSTTPSATRFVGEWYLKNLFGNLHGRQDWFLFAPIPLGARVRTRSTIIERYQRRNRDWVVNETDVLLDATGELLVRGHTHQSFLPPKQEPGGGRLRRRRGHRAEEGAAAAVPDRDRPRPRAAHEDRRRAPLLDVLGPEQELSHRPRAGEEARLPDDRRAGDDVDLLRVAADAGPLRRGLAARRAHVGEAHQRAVGRRDRERARPDRGRAA